jgi:hypothetical protein
MERKETEQPTPVVLPVTVGDLVKFKVPGL